MKKIIEKSIAEFHELKKIRKDKRYLIIDEEHFGNWGEFRDFQKFIERMIMLSRHQGLKIRGALVIEKRRKKDETDL